LRKAAAILVVVIGAVALALFLKGNSRTTTPTPAAFENRIPKLKQRLAELEKEIEQAVSSYAPKSKARIDDLAAPADDILRGLPGVVEVEFLVKAQKPTRRLIQLRDWHYVAKDLYAIDMKQVHGRELTEQEIDQLHLELLLEVELVQLEQLAILRCLIKHHGLKRVYSEGFSPNELEAYREKIGVLKAMEREQIPQIRKQLDEVRTLIDGVTGKEKEKAEGIERELIVLLDGHNERLLEVGAAGRLLISEELEDVLPLEEDGALDRANPITPNGTVSIEENKREARHDAQLRVLAKGSPVAVIILGGAHDLTGSVRRAGGGWEYLRVTTRGFNETGE
jgi:hypothetical protein